MTGHAGETHRWTPIRSPPFSRILIADGLRNLPVDLAPTVVHRSLNLLLLPMITRQGTNSPGLDPIRTRHCRGPDLFDRPQRSLRPEIDKPVVRACSSNSHSNASSNVS
ncbi:hypothetical protein [Nocardia pseudobrasiliensis]|uniref:hypothetical protein n=1 Tax=Nocardia pseudobrasiliensis TaxID=45979 RepID=UPI001471723A|nr:hypothetical protein [Nocardia pseudobrasiliensis]